jgi:hypothetical protein
VRLSRRDVLAALCAAPALRSATPVPLSLPARRNDFHQLLVPARIENSPPLWCELDSGGGGRLIFIDAAKAAAIGVQATFYGQSAGPMEGAPAPDLRTRVTLVFHGLKLLAQEMVIKPDALPGDKGFDRHAGAQPLCGRTGSRVAGRTPARTRRVPLFRFVAFPFSIEDNNPFTSATTLRDGRRVVARMVIDTGAVGSIAYFSRSTDTISWPSGPASVSDTMGRTACRIDAALSRWVSIVGAPVWKSGIRGQNEPDGMQPTFCGASCLSGLRARPHDPGADRSYTTVAFDASGLRVHRSPMRRTSFAPRYCPERRPPKRNCTSDLLVALDDLPVSCPRHGAGGALTRTRKFVDPAPMRCLPSASSSAASSDSKSCGSCERARKMQRVSRTGVRQ